MLMVSGQQTVLAGLKTGARHRARAPGVGTARLCQACDFPPLGLFPLPGMPFPRGKLLLMLQSPDSQLHFLSDGHLFSEVLAILCHSREAGIGAISQMREETEAQRGDLSHPRSHSRESRSGTWGYAGSVTDRLPGLRA